ncbi:MAG: hypothetical protein LHV69_07110 [Elusimicrobia bacterium]|nr:hypothetical protein [Candidatus Obscuribacterium magneticum]
MNIINSLERLFDNPRRFGWIVFLFLLAFNAGRLMDPPYWDGVTGVYSQGVWLANHHFDVARLCHQPPYHEGGPRVDLFYAYAFLFGLLSKLFSPATVFLLLHLLNLGFASVAISVCFKMIHKRLGSGISTLWILAAALDPIWSGQCAAIYLEVPLAAVVMLSLFYFGERDYGRAVLACVAGIFIKFSVLLLGLAFLVYVFLDTFLRRARKARGLSLPQALLLCVPFVVMVVLNQGHSLPVYPMKDVAASFITFFKTARLFFPGLTFLFSLALGLVGTRLIMRRREGPFSKGSGDTPLIALLIIYIGSFFISFIVYGQMMPRYAAMVLFPLVCLLAILLSNHRTFSAVLGCTLLMWGAFNQYGRGLPPLPLHQARSGNLLERSREFLLDLDDNRDICRWLEQEHYQSPILVKYPFTQMLTMPEMGYVKRPLPYVIGVGRFPQASAAIPYSPNLDLLMRPRVLGLYCANVYEQIEGPPLRPAWDDPILYRGGRGPETLIVYEMRK